MSGAVTPLREVDMTDKQLALVKRTLASDCNEDEFNLYIEVARRLRADPFRRHLYAVVYSKDDPKKRKMSLITGIDFYRTVAARNRDYRPDENPPTYTCAEEAKCAENPLGFIKAVVRCWKLGADNVWHQVAGEAYWTEYAPVEEVADSYDWVDTGEVWKDSGKPKKKKVPRGEVTLQPKGKWKDMPHVMLAKCAEAQALRKGWPEDLSGVYVAEEMDRATADDLTASERAEKAAVDRRLELTGGRDTMMFMWSPGEPLDPVPIGELADRCISFLHDAKDAPTITAWSETNRAPLQEFWARAKSDALGVKQFMERRLSELKPRPTAESAPADEADVFPPDRKGERK